ncbi:MAG: hypothetical protein JO024_04455 [Candidatus Eremiobacteraeota bacterium]|nr:hypothetical protein [Candidatus Eremiobacteraeota bacterium]
MDGIAWAASAMSAAQSRLEIAADNLANASSDGFRRRVASGFLSSRGARITDGESSDQGALRHTGRTFDLALIGRGAFTLSDPRGGVSNTRSGAFTRDRFGHLRDDAGRLLLGKRGAVRLPSGASIDDGGFVRSAGRIIDRIALPAGASIRSGFIETSNVNAISEMVDVLCAQRSFESAQKVLSAIDVTRQKATDELPRLK